MSSPEAPPGAAGAAGAPATAGTDGLTIASGEWGHTSITALWVPVLVLAHAYAAIWLYRAWRLETPAKTKDDKRGATVAVGGGYGAACAARARAALGAGRGAKRAGKGASAVPQVDVETPSPAASDQAPDCEVHADGGGDVAIPVKEAEVGGFARGRAGKARLGGAVRERGPLRAAPGALSAAAAKLR